MWSTRHNSVQNGGGGEGCLGKLPLDLQEQLLAFLPAPKLFELQVVCRAWRQLICSPSFKERWQSIRTSCEPNIDLLHVWMMKSHEGSLVVYIPMLRKSAPFSSFVTALPPTFGLSRTHHLRLLGGTGKFMFFQRVDAWGKPLTVYDTVTGQAKDLKHPYDKKSYSLSSRSVTMSTTDCASDCFRIILDVYGVRRGSLDVLDPNASFVWGRSTLCHELRVYNSETDCWVSFPQSSATQADPSDMNDAFCAEYLDFEHRKSTLHVWNLRKWMKVHVMFAEEAPVSDTTCKKKEGKCAYRWDINTFKAVKCEGHVFLASPMVEESRNIMVRGFIVWKLTRKGSEPSSSSTPSPPLSLSSLSSPSSLSSSSSPPSCTWVWSEVSRTPVQLLTILSCEYYHHPSFSSNGFCICMSSSLEPLIYDVSNGSWYCLTRKMQALFTMNLCPRITLTNAESVKQKMSSRLEDPRYLDL